MIHSPGNMIHRNCKNLIVWTSVLAVFLLDGVLCGQLCVYRKSVYNHLFSNYDKATQACEWGCCHHHDSPCCSAPISLIVGCILGGMLGITFLVIFFYCCCGCGSNSRNDHSDTRGVNGTEDVDRQGGCSALFHTESSQHADLETSISLHEPPPSYDEVMRGESNAAFKPD